jgi:hypothetical protein
MSVTKVKYGKPVPLLIDAKGFQDGRLVKFEIRKQKSGEEEKICDVNGVTRGEKGVGRWNPDFKVLADTKPLRKTTQVTNMDERFFFVARIDEKEVKSGEIVFTYPLRIFVKDTAGNPLDRVEYTIEFSDGSKKKGIIKKGLIEFEDAPSGKFELELEEEYEFADED